MKRYEFDLLDSAATEQLGANLARVLGQGGAVLYLQGELGAGKTTLTRALLRTLGHSGVVRSPSYTLIEPYELGSRSAFHLDLYRLSAPQELEFLGLRDLDPVRDLIIIEWPERGTGAIPAADITVRLAYRGEGRQAVVEGLSATGTTILSGLKPGSHSI
jgi:tRNA threonylcarbamoyladenosine biosynthesis protein TsaE